MQLGSIRLYPDFAHRPSVSTSRQTGDLVIAVKPGFVDIHVQGGATPQAAHRHRRNLYPLTGSRSRPEYPALKPMSCDATRGPRQG